MSILPEQQRVTSDPAWLPQARVPMAQEVALLTARLLDGRLSLESRRYDSRVLDLSSNENPLGPGVLAQNAVVREVCQLHRYPLVSSPMLRHRLAVELDVTENEIVIG